MNVKHVLNDEGPIIFLTLQEHFRFMLRVSYVYLIILYIKLHYSVHTNLLFSHLVKYLAPENVEYFIFKVKSI